MAYQTGLYTGVSNLFGLIRTFITGNGWAEVAYGAEGTGERLHVSRNGNHMAIRSGVAEAFFTNNGGGPLTGVGIYPSNSYDAGLNWDRQVGGPFVSGAGPCVDEVKVGGGIYHLFAHNGGDQIVLFVDTGDASGFVGDQQRQLSFGLTSLGYFFAAGSGNNIFKNNEARSYELGLQRMFLYSGVSQNGLATNITTILRTDTSPITWTTTANGGSTSFNGSLYKPVDILSASYRMAAFLWSNTPEEVISNPFLIPTYLVSLKADGTRGFLGSIPNLYMMNTNLKYLDESLAIGGDVFQISRCFPGADAEALLTRNALAARVAVACKVVV